MKRRIAVFTGTRAEYGLLYWLLKDIQASAGLDLQLIAAAAHYSPEFGETWRAIEDDGFVIDGKLEMLLSSDTRVGVLKSIGLGVIGLADIFDRLKPDALVVLGDRFEALSAAQAALILGIPLVHLHGGELTEGAYDDAIRHAITKMASLHFTSTEAYRNRVIQMGEAPETVFNVGALGLDHFKRADPMPWETLTASLGFELRKPFILATYHPATNANENPAETAKALFSALKKFPEHQIILTYPNADNGGREIISEILQFAATMPDRVLAVPSLGSDRYLTIVRNADCVVGNSSSGIIEVPSLYIPTVNIGHRQTGRLSSSSVINCGTSEQNIADAISEALSDEHRSVSKQAVNPYGAGEASSAIVEILGKVELKTAKRFFDLGQDAT